MAPNHLKVDNHCRADATANAGMLQRLLVQ